MPGKSRIGSIEVKEQVPGHFNTSLLTLAPKLPLQLLQALLKAAQLAGGPD